MTLYVTFEAIRAGEITFDSERRTTAPMPPTSRRARWAFARARVLTLDNALKMMMVKSANDIAVAVAETVGGSVAGFSDRMNDAAQRLGMTRSHFVTPNGLPDDDNYTTARDMALLARALLTEFREYSRLFQAPGDPDRRQGPEELQQAARALSRRDRHEDRLHLRLRLQSRRLGEARFARGDRGRVRPVWRQGSHRARGEAPRRRFRVAPRRKTATSSASPTPSRVPPTRSRSTCVPSSAARTACGPPPKDNDEGDDAGGLASDRRPDLSRAAGQGFGARSGRSTASRHSSRRCRGRGPVRTPTAPAADVLNAYAPGDASADSAPADAIGAAAGSRAPARRRSAAAIAAPSPSRSRSGATLPSRVDASKTMAALRGRSSARRSPPSDRR